MRNENTEKGGTKKPKLDLHIGTHKTGTSAIQASLNLNRNRLRRQGVIFLGCPHEKFNPLMRATQIEPTMVAAMKDFFDKRITNDSARYLLSWEGLSGDPYNGYTNSPVVAETIHQASQGLDARIILYLRRQDDFIESLYTQLIHEGGSESFKDFISRLDEPMFNWQRLVDSFAARFGHKRIIVRPYSKSALPTSTSLFEDFFSILGVDSGSLRFSENLLSKNSGYSRQALELARQCNPWLQPQEQRQLRMLLRVISHKDPFQSYSYWTEADRASWLARYADTNRQVARTYLEHASEELFPATSCNSLQHGNSNQVDAVFDGCEECDDINMTPLLVRMLLSATKAPQKRPSLGRQISNQIRTMLSRLRRYEVRKRGQP